jgi:hypothetical protein
MNRAVVRLSAGALLLLCAPLGLHAQDVVPKAQDAVQAPHDEAAAPAAASAPAEPAAPASTDEAAAPPVAADPAAASAPATADASAASTAQAASQDEQALLDATSALMLAQEQPSYPKLSLYGFADFSASKVWLPHDTLLNEHINTHPSFWVGNTNVYIDSQISQRARSLIEVRLTLLPNGSTAIDGTTQRVLRTSTAVSDATIIGRETAWGGIFLERVVLSYDFHQLATLTVGRFITPWGIWNIDHGSPALISVTAPLMLDDQWIPRRQTGMQLSGSWDWSAIRAGYFLTISNGRGPADGFRDYDNNKAVGGRFFASTHALGELTLGTTWYYGMATDPHTQFVRAKADGTDAHVETVAKTQYKELAIGGDLKWEYRGLLLVGEVLALQRQYANGGQVANFGEKGLVPLPNGDTRTDLSADSINWGAYSILGYRLPWYGVMPFVDFELNRSGKVPSNGLFVTQTGLNIRPEPGLVVKLVAAYVRFLDPDGSLFTSDPKFWGFYSQVAWAF